jgi:lipoprotein-releasing system permease protein
LNTELFIARRLFFAKESKGGISNSVLSIAIFGIALGMAVMILSVAIVTGFKEQVQRKVTGFGSHIIISSYDNNNSYLANPVSKKQSFYPDIENREGIKHIQVFATKAGIIKTETDIQGVVLKGIDHDYDWSFFEENMVEGSSFKVTEGEKGNNVVVSKYLASLLRLNVGDDLFMYFVHDPIMQRKFSISGIYSTDLQEFDKLFVLADIGHVQKLNGWNEDQVDGFEILIDDFHQLDLMKSEVNNEVGTIYEEGKELLYVESVRDKYPQIFEWLELTNTNVWVILIIMVIVGTINMVSGLLVIILERTSMIGVLKALGAKSFSISKVFLYHGAFLIVKGLVLGNIIGLGLGFLQHYFGIVKLDPATYYIDSVPINFKLWHILALNAGTLFITTLVLVLPSLFIAFIRPAKAIKFA